MINVICHLGLSYFDFGLIIGRSSLNPNQEDEDHDWTEKNAFQNVHFVFFLNSFKSFHFEKPIDTKLLQHLKLKKQTFLGEKMFQNFVDFDDNF